MRTCRPWPAGEVSRVVTFDAGLTALAGHRDVELLTALGPDGT
ncbi:hypothetical protein ACI8AC_01015 [Geodermatophilus sp. SYSU D00758]